MYSSSERKLASTVGFASGNMHRIRRMHNRWSKLHARMSWHSSVDAKLYAKIVAWRLNEGTVHTYICRNSVRN